MNLFGIEPGTGPANVELWDDRLDQRAVAVRVADDANFLGYTIYPVDVQGLRSRDTPVEEEPGSRENLQNGNQSIRGVPRGEIGPDAGQRATSTGFTGELLRQGALRFLAGETGGRALLFADRTDALEAELADTRTYYSLGFSARVLGNGARHSVRVETTEPGLEARARTGYRDISRGAELDLLAESALRLLSADDGDSGEIGLGADEDSALEVRLGRPRRADRGTMRVPLHVEIPGSDLTLLPSAGSLLARLEVRVAVRDRRGELSEMAHIPFNVVREAQPLPGRKLRWGSDLTLRRERHVLLVSLYDAVAGRTWTRTLTVEP